jgi:hypothetical protein
MAPTIGPKVRERITHIKPINVHLLPSLYILNLPPFPLHIQIPSAPKLTAPQPAAGSGLEIFTAIGSASRVLNIVSTGLDGELYLTFTFEWEHEEIQAGSAEEVAKQKEYQTAAPKGVAGALAVIRNMVAAGEL